MKLETSREGILLSFLHSNHLESYTILAGEGRSHFHGRLLTDPDTYHQRKTGLVLENWHFKKKKKGIFQKRMPRMFQAC